MFKKNNKGVSFYELVISLFLINLVIFSVLSVITMLLRGSRHVNENSKGAVAANSIMNKYMSNDLNIEDPKAVQTIEFAGVTYYYLIEETVIEKNSTGKPGLNNIKLTLSLNEKLRTNKAAYLANPDPQDISIVTLRVCDVTPSNLEKYKDTETSTGGSDTGGGNLESNNGTNSSGGSANSMYDPTGKHEAYVTQ